MLSAAMQGKIVAMTSLFLEHLTDEIVNYVCAVRCNRLLRFYHLLECQLRTTTLQPILCFVRISFVVDIAKQEAQNG